MRARLELTAEEVERLRVGRCCRIAKRAEGTAEIWAHNSLRVARSSVLPVPDLRLCNSWSIHHVPSRHGVHFPQDSCL